MTRLHAQRLVLFLVCLFGTSVAMARTHLQVGVLAFRPPEVLTERWQPMADYLRRQLGQAVEVKAYSMTDLNAAIARSEIDAVITNPGHFIQLQHRNGVSAALATLITDFQGQPVAAFGGVIFTRRTEAAIDSLQALAGRRIAVTDRNSLGGYQMQAYQMVLAGLEEPDPQQLVLTGLPHDRVVEAVLQGRADVGFVRSGLLEAMVSEGRVPANSFRVVAAQEVPDYPFAVSTRLYPEWPVGVLPQVDADLTRRLTVALLSLSAQHAAARAAGIRGFTNTANYAGVEAMLRTMRRPPFDVVPTITLADLWARYRHWILALAALLALVAGTGVRLAWQGRRLRASERRQEALRSDLQSTIEAIPDLLFEMGLDGTQYRLQAPREDVLVRPIAELLGRSLTESLPSAASATYLQALQEAHTHGLSRGAAIELVVQGETRWFELSVARKASSAEEGPRFIVLSRDITERKRFETRLQLAASVFNHTREAIMVTDTEGRILELNAAFTTMTGFTREDVLGHNPRVLKSGRHDASHYAQMWQAVQEHGFWVGEMWNRRKDGQDFACVQNVSVVTDAHGQPLHYVALLTDITLLKDHQRQLELVTHYDTLTGLPNRVLLNDRLQQALAQSQRHRRSLAVVNFDLDEFKAVNDAMGHATGDALLKAIAQHVKASLREGDTLARVSGDEFVVLLVELDGANGYEALLSRLLDAVARPALVEGTTIQVSASMGVTMYPQDGADADQLLRHANQAMYLAKQAGKNCYRLFDIQHDAVLQAQREGVQRIVQALEASEFVLHYQPKVNMKTHTVIGVEALVRWQHPERGLLAPGHFLPLIEDHPVSVALGEWVMRAALKQMAVWQDQGLPLKVSVNIGARQLQEHDFSQRLAALLGEFAQVPAAWLELEILETSALADIAQVTRILHECQALGVSFALDDFGTGYSSLTYLRRLPAEMLKIDQSFVRGMLEDQADLAIVKGVIGLAAAFRREVIAEGVETATHGELLLQLGCVLAQGYGISRPLPASAVPEWVARWTASGPR